jgi:hypothetical protein
MLARSLGAEPFCVKQSKCRSGCKPMIDSRMANRELCGVKVDIDFSSNSTVREMFNNPEAFRELLAFFKENGLTVVNAFTGGGHATTSIKLQGPAPGLRKFVAEYLSRDPVEGVYKLLYDGNVKG